LNPLLARCENAGAFSRIKAWGGLLMATFHRWLAAAVSIPIALAFGALTTPAPASAQNRLALVVGNNDYANLGADKQLHNAISDARLMRGTLQGLGFEVLYGENLDRRSLIDRLFDFAARLGKDDIAFVFFAGHGVSFSGANYLLPSDIPAPRASGRAEEGRLAEQAIAEATVIERITAAGARVAIVVLDACRDNPLQGSGRRSVGATRGLAQSQPVRGVFSIYSAGFGQTALDRLGPDDRHPNSVFTRVFIEKLKMRGLDLRAVVTQTRGIVVEMTQRVGHDQFPAYYDQVIGGDVYLAGLPAAGGPAVQATPQPIPVDPCAAATDHWRSVEAIGSKAAFEDHLARFSNCAFAGLARARMGALVSPVPETAPRAGGGIYDHTYVANRNDCEWVCSRDRRCQSYVYEANSKKCQLSAAPSGSTGRPSAAAPPPSGSAIAPSRNHTFVSTSADCKFVCEQNTGCRSYSFDASTKKCFYESAR
jgi:hypothetical protein